MISSPAKEPKLSKTRSGPSIEADLRRRNGIERCKGEIHPRPKRKRKRASERFPSPQATKSTESGKDRAGAAARPPPGPGASRSLREKVPKASPEGEVIQATGKPAGGRGLTGQTGQPMRGWEHDTCPSLCRNIQGQNGHLCPFCRFLI